VTLSPQSLTRTSNLKDDVSNRLGDVGELVFLTEATRRGFTVSIPWTAACQYDFITEFKGTICRVQVKASTSSPRNGYRFNCKRHGNKPYLKEDVDVFAFVSPSGSVHFKIPPLPVTVDVNFEQVCENWSLLQHEPYCGHKDIAKQEA